MTPFKRFQEFATDVRDRMASGGFDVRIMETSRGHGQVHAKWCVMHLGVNTPSRFLSHVEAADKAAGCTHRRADTEHGELGLVGYTCGCGMKIASSGKDDLVVTMAVREQRFNSREDAASVADAAAGKPS